MLIAGECGKNNNSNPCQHICLDLHDGTYECSCFYGFALAVDGYSCASIEPQSPNPSAAILSSAKPQSGSREPSESQSRQSAAEYEKSRQQIRAADNIEPGSVPTTTGGDDRFMAKGAPFIVQRANDNRKLVEELANGAKLSNNEIGVQDEGEIGFESEKGRRQRRLLTKVPLWMQLPASNSVRSSSNNNNNRSLRAEAANIVVSEAKPQTTVARSIASAAHSASDQIRSDEGKWKYTHNQHLCAPVMQMNAMQILSNFQLQPIAARTSRLQPIIGFLLD